jgi:hypothetical protein
MRSAQGRVEPENPAGVAAQKPAVSQPRPHGPWLGGQRHPTPLPAEFNDNLEVHRGSISCRRLLPARHLASVGATVIKGTVASPLYFRSPLHILR